MHTETSYLTTTTCLASQSCWFHFVFQSSAADVIYCIFNRRKDSNGTNRRQVQAASLNHSCLIFFPFSVCFAATFMSHTETRFGQDWRSWGWCSRAETPLWTEAFTEWVVWDIQLKFKTNLVWIYGHWCHKTFLSGQWANILRDWRWWVKCLPFFPNTSSFNLILHWWKNHQVK